MQILHLNFHFVIESAPRGPTTPAFLAIYCPQVVDMSPLRRPNLVSRAECVGAEEETSSKVNSVDKGNGGKQRHEGRQSLQVCFNLGAIPA